MSAWGKVPRRVTHDTVDFLGEQVDIVGQGGGAVEALAGASTSPAEGEGVGVGEPVRADAGGGFAHR